MEVHAHLKNLLTAPKSISNFKIYSWYARKFCILFNFGRLRIFVVLGTNYQNGITHVFSCINICLVPRKLFEHEANRLSVQTSSEVPGKC